MEVKDGKWRRGGDVVRVEIIRALKKRGKNNQKKGKSKTDAEEG